MRPHRDPHDPNVKLEQLRKRVQKVERRSQNGLEVTNGTLDITNVSKLSTGTGITLTNPATGEAHIVASGGGGGIEIQDSLGNNDINPAALLKFNATNFNLSASSGTTSDVAFKALAVSWTPTLTAGTTNPTGWSATRSGFYIRLGNFVHVAGLLQASSGATAGTGQWEVSLPILPSYPTFLGRATLAGDGIFSTSYMTFDASLFSQTGTGTFSMYYPATWPRGTFTAFGSTSGWTVSTNDTLLFNLSYQV